MIYCEFTFPYLTSEGETDNAVLIIDSRTPEQDVLFSEEILPWGSGANSRRESDSSACSEEPLEDPLEKPLEEPLLLPSDAEHSACPSVGHDEMAAPHRQRHGWIKRLPHTVMKGLRVVIRKGKACVKGLASCCMLKGEHDS